MCGTFFFISGNLLCGIVLGPYGKPQIRIVILPARQIDQATTNAPCYHFAVTDPASVDVASRTMIRKNSAPGVGTISLVYLSPLLIIFP